MKSVFLIFLLLFPFGAGANNAEKRARARFVHAFLSQKHADRDVF